MKAREFDKVFGDEFDFWGEHPEFSVEDWEQEVEGGDTRLGYWDWVQCQIEQAEEDKALKEGIKAYEVEVLWRTTEEAVGSVVVRARSPDEAKQMVANTDLDIDYRDSEIIDGEHEILGVKEVK